MRLVTYRSDRGERAGVLRDEVVVDAWDALGGGGTSVRELLASERLDELAGRIAGAEGLPLDGLALRPPVPDPGASRAPLAPPHARARRRRRDGNAIRRRLDPRAARVAEGRR